MPCMNKCIDSLEGANTFLTLDASSEYRPVEISEDDLGKSEIPCLAYFTDLGKWLLG